jgi:Sugar (and other) transporter
MVQGVAFQNFAYEFEHISDPNERRRLALAEIDRAPFSWSHVRAIIVAGTGFFTSAYELFIINLVTPMLGVVYWMDSPNYHGSIPSSADTAIKTATSGGNILGQVGFGILADIVGRKKMYGLELIIMILATLAQAISSSSPNVSIVGVLVFWRVVMGIVRDTHDAHEPWLTSNAGDWWRLPTIGHYHLRVRNNTVARVHDGRRIRHAGCWPILRQSDGSDHGEQP